MQRLEIKEIIKLIEPAVNLEKTITEQRDSGNELYVEKVCFLNVRKQIERILHLSPIINEMVNDKKIAIIGGVYSLSSGLFVIDSEN